MVAFRYHRCIFLLTCIDLYAHCNIYMLLLRTYKLVNACIVKIANVCVATSEKASLSLAFLVFNCLILFACDATNHSIQCLERLVHISHINIEH